MIDDLLKSLNLEFRLIPDEYFHNCDYPYELISLKNKWRVECHIKQINDNVAYAYKSYFKDIIDFQNAFLKIDYFYFPNPFTKDMDNPYFGCKSLEEAIVKKDLMNL